MREIKIKLRQQGGKETSVHADKKRLAKKGYKKHKGNSKGALKMLAEIDTDTAENIGLQYVQETYLGLLDVIFVYEKDFHKDEADKEKEADFVKGFQLVLEYMMPPSEFKSFVEAGRWTTAIQDLSDEELDELEPKLHEKVWRTEKNRRAREQARSWATSGNKYMNEEKIANGN